MTERTLEQMAQEQLTKTILGALQGLSCAQLRQIEREAEAVRLERIPMPRPDPREDA